MIPILTGLAAGGLHVFAGVDHLAVLAPIAVEEPSAAGRTGAYWGLGHGLGVGAVGLVGLLLRSLVDVDAWSAWAEFLVGFLLVGVGVWAVARARRLEVHDHPHEHPDAEHRHVHTHGRSKSAHQHAALGVGMFHGMAGSGHLFGVLPALALPTGEAVLYLAAYLLAAVISMSLFAFTLGTLTRRGGPKWIRRIMFGSGVVAMAVGVVWIATSRPF